MNRDDQYIEPDNSYYEPSRDPSQGTLILVVFMTFLSVILTSVLAFIYFSKNNKDKDLSLAEASGNGADTYISVASPTPTPVPPIQSYQNPLLYPATASVVIDPEAEIDPDCDPSVRGLTQNVINGEVIVSDFDRAYPIYMTDPLDYSVNAGGILTYRGNNFRNTATYGYVTPEDGTIDELNQIWEFHGMTSRLSSDMTFEWTGLQLTGQPLVVNWSNEFKNSMNLYESAAAKTDLTEVIVAALDGYVYFFDLDDGSMTRDPIYVGASMKGTPSVDPRGYPLLYVGQGDDNGDSGFGMYIYSLIDGTRLYFYEGLDDGAYRMNWGAFDSSPLVDRNSDTLIWPCENGIIYTFRLNTDYVMGGASISINPMCTGYKYIFNDTQGRYLGVESSIGVYGNYGYFIDNNSNLVCLDLNSFEMVWVFRTSDDSDLSPALEEENGIPYIYLATEVDYQGGVAQYSGAAYTYKINGLTGEEVWQTSQSCYTYNGQTSDTDQTGGCLGNPVLGKNSISNLVIFSYSMTNDLMSGNRLVAYYKDTGTEAWHYDMNIYSYSSPIDCYDENGNAYIIIADSIGQIHLVNGQTGERISYIQASRFIGTSDETTGGVSFEASPVIYNDTMVIGTRSGSVFGIRIE